MKRMIAILISSLAIHLFAADFTPFAAPTSVPLAEMRSVSNTSFMSSGSTYSSDIYEIGASAPSSYRHSVRKSGLPGTGGESTGYDPNNPQFSPIGDGVWVLLLLAALYVWHRRRAARAMVAACCVVASVASPVHGQQSVRIGSGSYASYAPLSASRTDERGGSQAYQTEHRKLYLPDSLLARLGAPDG
ncbi:MAG: hypothetical protein J6P74_08315, partial [Paludibacteraceae bacterium]|nr:hypothetical protein [Paludibacteraceae bacterium]